MEVDHREMTPLKAIRAKCLDCCCNQYSEVRDCQVIDCKLWRFRFGKGLHKRNISPEHLARLKLGLKNTHKKEGDESDD